MLMQHRSTLQGSQYACNPNQRAPVGIRSSLNISRRGYRNARNAVTPAAVETPASSGLSHQQAGWKEFANNFSGEWEGVTASFSGAGEPQQLPEHYVPQAFRDWGVELWDWQSQCSCLATPDSSSSSSSSDRKIKSVVRRLMPTVGCEADAIAFTEEDASSSSSSSSSSSNSGDSSSTDPLEGLYFTADGSYTSGPAALASVSKDAGPSKLHIEHCFMLPAAGPSSSEKFRVKVVQQFRKNWSSGAWILDAVDLHKEQYDGPYTGKRELAGCGGGQPGIAQLPALQANHLAGNWAAADAGSSSVNQQEPSLSCLDAAGAAPEGVQLTLLPLQAWSAVQLSPGGQLHRAEAGVLLSDTPQQQQQAEGADGSTAGSSSHRIVSSRVYDVSSGQLAEVDITQETKA